jgi:tRNA G18 (ribose-2'-O)-methylase SpoU
MAFVQIDGCEDPRVAEYREVSDPELLHRRGLFVAEGRLVVGRVLADHRYAVRSVLVSAAARRSLAPALESIAPSVPVFVCDGADFLGITGHDFHRGCLALVKRPGPRALDEVLRPARLVVGLDAVGNPDNVGGVFRSAAAFGVDAVILGPGCCDPLYRKAIRTSMAATLGVPFVLLDEWPDALSKVRAAGFTTIALTPREPSDAIDAFAARPRPPRVALLVGAEGPGLTPALEAAADCRVRIPIRAAVDSLNLAVATGIALHRLSSRSS